MLLKICQIKGSRKRGQEHPPICVRSHSGEIVAALKKVTDPDVLSKSLRPWADRINCIVLETGRMKVWKLQVHNSPQIWGNSNSTFHYSQERSFVQTPAVRDLSP